MSDFYKVKAGRTRFNYKGFDIIQANDDIKTTAISWDLKRDASMLDAYFYDEKLNNIMVRIKTGDYVPYVTEIIQPYDGQIWVMLDRYHVIRNSYIIYDIYLSPEYPELGVEHEIDDQEDEIRHCLNEILIAGCDEK